MRDVQFLRFILWAAILTANGVSITAFAASSGASGRRPSFVQRLVSVQSKASDAAEHAATILPLYDAKTRASFEKYKRDYEQSIIDPDDFWE